MQTLNEKIEALKIQHEKELQELQTIADFENSIKVKPKRVDINGIYGAKIARFDADSLTDALRLIDQLTIQPFDSIKSACLSFKPLALCKESEKDNAQGNEWFLNIEVSQGDTYCTVSLEGYAVTEYSEIFRFEIKVKGPDYIGNYYKMAAKVSQDGKKQRFIKSANPILDRLSSKTISWAYGNITDRSCQYTYLIETIDQLKEIVDSIESTERKQA